jgi:beta-barrel assembly-enhancing protease
VRVHGKRRRSTLGLALILAIGPLSNSAYSSSDKTRAREARDINAIGHRVIGYQQGLGNWYSLEKEKEIGAQVSAAFEKSTTLLPDPITRNYLDRLAQTIARNSDSKLPVTLRVIDSDDSYALTLLGGYQYITRGLLLQLQSEGELAAAIARGIAHTALRSATGEATRTSLMKMMTIPLIFMGQDGAAANSSDPGFAVPLTFLKFRREDEFAADYFGAQYLYKSGYATESFIGFIQKAWPSSGTVTAKAFSPFPPLPERLKALEKEIKEILPQRNGAITNTVEFAAFREHLLSLPPVQPSPKQPTLLRSDRQQLN